MAPCASTVLQAFKRSCVDLLFPSHRISFALLNGSRQAYFSMAFRRGLHCGLYTDCTVLQFLRAASQKRAAHDCFLFQTSAISLSLSLHLANRCCVYSWFYFTRPHGSS